MSADLAMSAAALKASTQAAYDEARLKDVRVLAAINLLRKARVSGNQAASIDHLSIRVTHDAFKVLKELGYDLRTYNEVATKIGFAE